MYDNTHSSPHFEYVFYFLFRTYFWKPDGNRWNEPATLGFDTSKRRVLKHGIPFEEDKRLFRRDVPPGTPLDKWGEQLKHNWQAICQLYIQHFDYKKKSQAEAFCQQALLGVALLVLEEDESLDQHAVNVAVDDPNNPILRFEQPPIDQPLFRIRTQNFNKTASLHRFMPVTQAGKPFHKNLQLDLTAPRNTSLPRLTKMVEGELVANSVFSVYGFTYGGQAEDWKSAVTRVLIKRSPNNRPPLLSTVFARLITEQWQFERIDEAANQLRPKLQQKKTYYAHYAKQFEGARPACTGTRKLENQLQAMHILNNDATFLMSRIQTALKTLEINGDNLAERLEELRQEAEQVNWQLYFQLSSELKPVEWPPVDKAMPILSIFHLHINNLQDHHAYLEQQIEYLKGLQERWHFYLENRRAQSGEHLNTLATVLILMLAGTGVTFNIGKGRVGVTSEEQLIYFALLALLLTPLILHFGTKVIKVVCCIFHGTWVDKLLCHNPISRWIQSIEWFRWFKKG